jgi:hypothetical protein
MLSTALPENAPAPGLQQGDSARAIPASMARQIAIVNCFHVAHFENDVTRCMEPTYSAPCPAAIRILSRTRQELAQGRISFSDRNAAVSKISRSNAILAALLRLVVDDTAALFVQSTGESSR